jgi:hypothetical protein
MQGFDDGGVELGAGGSVAVEFLTGGFVGACLAVGGAACHVVVGVADADDSCAEEDVFAAEAVG